MRVTGRSGRPPFCETSSSSPFPSLCRSLRLCPRLTRAAAPPPFSPPPAAAPQFNPLSGGESAIPGAGRLLLPPVSGPPWSVQLGAPRGQQALAGGWEWEGEGEEAAAA